MTQSTILSPWTKTRFGKPHVGATAERRRETREADIVAFTEMTGDRNPLHYDRELAKRSVFGRLIVQGGDDGKNPQSENPFRGPNNKDFRRNDGSEK